MRRYIALFMVFLALCALVFPAAADNCAPVAENFEFETYRGVSFGGELAAVDPDGDAVSFEITTEPKKGTIELSDNGSFVYTPAEGKRGRDYFGYRAVDAQGNRSQEATVIIKLVKNRSVSYADMDGEASYCSAVRLAECGAFIGRQIGGEYYFEPQETLTRGEFVSMCLCVTGADVLSGVVSTGFADDGSIPDWQRAYVASAVRDGVVKGRAGAAGAVFDAGADISRAEAGVMLNRLLRLTNAGYGSDTAETWTAQAAANLDACGIMDGASLDSAALTHAEAADMLSAAMDVLKNR